MIEVGYMEQQFNTGAVGLKFDQLGFVLSYGFTFVVAWLTDFKDQLAVYVNPIASAEI
tara:strand:+ start:108 stop:281 length:174 start_codon:yes stop_codon:yes gene_type:complete